MSSTTSKTEEHISLARQHLSPDRNAEPQPAGERFPSLDVSRPNGNLLAVASPLEYNAALPTETKYKWPTRRSSQRVRIDARTYTHRSRQSVSAALDNFRTRRGSVTDNAQELAEALRAPVSYKLIALCIVWYMTSALTNTSSKSILTAFPKPVTLTLVQFASVSMWCLILAYFASTFPAIKRAIPALRNGILRPSTEVISTALPLSFFGLGGHLLSSYATQKIPVSLVHTIKGLSPLFTVLAYRVLFRIRYARATYLSLVPLTVGVMMACSTDFSSNFWGIGCAFMAAIVFVSQNIFSKKLFTEVSRAETEVQITGRRQLDKLNLLCYCSVGAFILTAPVWLLTEGFSLIGDIWHDGAINISNKKGTMDHGELALEFIFNGVFHFGQNLMAFVLLSRLSPVSYSVASLIKRVWVILVAVIWFRNSTKPIQAFGIALTFFGLYLYDRTSTEDAAERRTRSDHFRHGAPLLPLAQGNDTKFANGHVPQLGTEKGKREQGKPDLAALKRDDEMDSGRPSDTNFSSAWLPPGTTQESTWEPGDSPAKS